MHLLSPHEKEPPAIGAVTLQDSNGDIRRLRLDPAQIRGYKKRFAAWTDAWKQDARELGCHYLQIEAVPEIRSPIKYPLDALVDCLLVNGFITTS